jgi:trehalose/maltose hydrolase-like predicted phosphorylase
MPGSTPTNDRDGNDTAIHLSPWGSATRPSTRGGERTREALFAQVNGYFCVRATAAEAVADDMHYPGT